MYKKSKRRFYRTVGKFSMIRKLTGWFIEILMENPFQNENLKSFSSQNISVLHNSVPIFFKIRFTTSIKRENWAMVE